MRIWLSLLVGAALASGCNDNTPPVVVVTSPALAATVAENGAVTSATLFAATDAFAPVTNGVVILPDAAAAAAAGAVGNYYAAGCATATAVGNSVNYTLHNCNGPLGVVGLSGTYSAAYTAQTNGVQVAVTSTNLTVGGATVSLNATGVYTQSGTERLVAVQNQGSGVNTDGNEFVLAQSGQISWIVGQQCVTQDTTGSVTITGVSASQATTNVLRCTNQCPSSGSVTVSANGANVAVTYNGTANAPFTASDGTTGTVPLACSGLTSPTTP